MITAGPDDVVLRGFARVANERQMLHLERVRFAHVGGVDDDQGVLVDEASGVVDYRGLYLRRKAFGLQVSAEFCYCTRVLYPNRRRNGQRIAFRRGDSCCRSRLAECRLGHVMIDPQNGMAGFTAWSVIDHHGIPRAQRVAKRCPTRGARRIRSSRTR